MIDFPRWLYSASQPKGVLCATEADATELPDEDWFLSPAHLGTDEKPFLSKEPEWTEEQVSRMPPDAFVQPGEALANGQIQTKEGMDAARATVKIDKRTKAYKESQA